MPVTQADLVGFERKPRDKRKEDASSEVLLINSMQFFLLKSPFSLSPYSRFPTSLGETRVTTMLLWQNLVREAHVTPILLSRVWKNADIYWSHILWMFINQKCQLKTLSLKSWWPPPTRKVGSGVNEKTMKANKHVCINRNCKHKCHKSIQNFKHLQTHIQIHTHTRTRIDICTLCCILLCNSKFSQ